jgi:hypothetical protein
MPRLTVFLLVSLPLLAQQSPVPPGGIAAQPRNLKILVADDTLMDAMQGFNEALGVQCNYCHVPGDFASDANARKETARKMIAMVRQVETFFPSTGGAFPRGYHEVDCSTCHRGSVKPETKAPIQFLNKRDAAGAIPPDEPSTNLKVLPPGTPVHGEGSVMEDFRDALNVDCGYCHGGTKGFADDGNPRKEFGRKMILMVRSINANFPGTGVFPEGPQAVTCYTCHRAGTHPTSLSNKRYTRPIAAH